MKSGLRTEGQYLAQGYISHLLRYLGVDPDSPGLKETPRRVVAALEEMTVGYKEDPKVLLSTVFDEDYDEIVILKDIPFVSLCEHHLLVFSGTADVGYLPGGKVVGLSKLARLVDCFARRLQVQERLTKQIAEAIQEHLGAKGVGAVIRASHSCMACRGVRKPGATMITSAMLGVFRENPAARAEFLDLCK